MTDAKSEQEKDRAAADAMLEQRQQHAPDHGGADPGAANGSAAHAESGRRGALRDGVEHASRARSPQLGGEWDESQGLAPPGWDDCIIVRCVEPTRHGERTVYRRASAEPRAFPLAARLPGRVVRLRGYGNAIVPQLAAVFVRAYLTREGG